ncbi:hypothetical protein [Wenjunlia tyrosinilytica]|uniref:Uncharacterized protein n=1 Tax=Wenjunlia tyrosinilytica TaxID=1544741 RepID=A0A917ZVU9_9ACTN|nr:hypothetical protein [Wenjunlia tyrosinilytica]GGO94905.1 hypothetical protein GCM10012280_50890 [Wenjunlia tyrosinilytica]
MPDFFDRLLARHAPDRRGAPGGAARVRPRLPGPFERVETTGVEPLEPSLPSAGAPGSRAAAAHPAPGPGRAESAAGPAPTPAGPRPASSAHDRRPRPEAPRAAAPAPLLVAPPVPTAVPGPIAQRVQRRRPEDGGGGREERRAQRPQQPRSAPAGPQPAVRPAPAPAPARPQAPRRAAAKASDAERRRRRQPAEQVVHVSIGRLEVKAAERKGAAKPVKDTAAGRPAPSMKLDQYLSRGEARP